MNKKDTISKFGFLMSVLGAAVGLGGIWGFPTTINKYGGAFFVPYFIALIVCAAPILLIEMNLGNKYRKNHVQVFESLAGKTGRYFGFLQTSIVGLMSVFYSVLVAWSLLAFIMAFLPGLTTKNFFLEKLIGETNDNPQNFSQLGNISFYVLISLLLVWILTAIILLGGVTKGIDIANKIFIPILFVILLAMMIYTLTLDGASLGIKKLFNFHSANLLKTSIWTDAFGQAFFIMSTCTGAIIIFSSHAPKNQNNSKQSIIVVASTSIVAIITSIVIFSTIGAIARNKGLPIDEVFKSGPTLIFQVFPQVFAIISKKSLILSHFIAIIFFLSIFFAGISSLIAQVEAVINPIVTEWKTSRFKAIVFVIIFCIFLNIIFIFNNSSKLIYGLATWVAGIWQMIIGIIELIGVMWIWKCYPEIMEFHNKNSWIKWDKFFFRYFCLLVIPIIIMLNLGLAFDQLIKNIVSNTLVYLTIGTTIGLGIAILLAFLLANSCTIKKFLNNILQKLKFRK